MEYHDRVNASPGMLLAFAVRAVAPGNGPIAGNAWRAGRDRR